MVKLLAEVEPKGQRNGQTTGPVYRVAYAKDGAPKLDNGAQTLFESFEKSAVKYADRPCLGQRALVDGKFGPFEFMTYKEVADVVALIASAYVELGLEPTAKVSILGANSKEWMMAMQGISRVNLCCVPLYETLGENAVEFIIKHSETKLVVASAAKLPELVKAMKSTQSVVTCGVVYWGEPKAETVKAIQDLGYKVLSWTQLLDLGRSKPHEPVKPAPEDLCTIMYTSGTTGDPKGVMISHRALAAHVASAQAFLIQYKESISTEDVFLSYLPLAHIFDRLVEEFMIHCGASIGYWGGDIRKIMDDIDALRPTFFAGVPRVFERIYNGVQDQVKKGGPIKGAIFKWAFGRKLQFMKSGFSVAQASKVADKLVFDKVKNRLGGRVRVILSGGAPLTPQVEEFLRVAMCAPVVQGYGLTETCAASFISAPDVMSQMGTVGGPMPVTEVRLESIAEMEYDPVGKPPRGEVCIRGPGLFSGYYKDEEKTKEAIDEDGFFHSGDIGEFTEEGALRIVDRIKNVFKLSQGEYIAVEKVENAYKACSVVEQVWVYGNSHESVLVAVAVPKQNDLKKWAEANNVPGDYKELCRAPGAVEYILKELRAAGKAGGLKSLEDIKAVFLDHEQFSEDNGLMTPTFKLKRAPLLKYYQKQVDEMYAALKNKGQAS